MATIVRRTNKDGSITYLVRVRRKNAPPQTATFPKRSDAKKWAQVTEGTVLAGRHFPSGEATRHTVGELIDRYLREVLPHKRPSTVYGQTYQLRWWKTQLGQRSLADITPPVLVEHREKLARDRSNSTVNRYLAVLSHAFTVAIQDWEWLDHNPVRKVSKPKEPRGRVRFLSDDERERLLASCTKSRNPYLYTVVILALSTGARRGELLGLTWQNIDFPRGTMLLEDTKNGERRVLPLAGHALELMRQHAKERRGDTDLVFPSSTGNKPMRIRDAWEYAVKRAGVKDIRFHDLHHSAASYMLMNGASLAEIGEILGHKSFEMTKRYAHLSESHTRGVVERMNAAIFGKECDQAERM